MTGYLLSPVPKIDYARLTTASTKKEAVKFMVRIEDTVLIEKENGELVVLYHHPTRDFSKGAYCCQVWRGVEKILKCMLKLGRITKEELQTHVDAANKHQIKQSIKYDIESIDRFRKDFDLTDAQYAKLLERAKNGAFVKPEELYKV